MAARTTQQPEEPQAVEENEVTRPSDLGFGNREIEVDPIQEVTQTPDDQGYVIVQMMSTIEEFTYGSPHVMFRLEQGKRYRVPVHIAQYLNDLGFVR